MSDGTLTERIARVLHNYDYAARIRLDEQSGRPASQETADTRWRSLPEWVRVLWRAQATGVIEALNLEAGVAATITALDGTVLGTEYTVEGGWTEIGDDQ